MELEPKQAGLYTVVYAGGAGPVHRPSGGHGNPNLADQTLMHANNEFKHIAMAPDEVKREAVSVIHLSYEAGADGDWGRSRAPPAGL